MEIGDLDTTLYTTQPKREPKGDDLGKDDFMKLLIAGIQYQDPLEPQSNEEFIAQTAQFTSLEEQQKLNQTMEQFIDYQSKLSGVSLIGRDVHVKNNLMNIVTGDGQKQDISFSTKELDLKDGETIDAKIEVKDMNGVTQTIIDVPNVGKDEDKTIEWDKRDAAGNFVEDGQYEFFVTAKMPSGEEVGLSTYDVSKVVSISVNQAETKVKLANGNFVDLRNITEVE